MHHLHIGNRTIAFIGDSQSRDIAVGVAYLLMGMTLEKSSDKKFDKVNKKSAF